MNKKVKYLLIFVTLTSLLFLSCQIGLGKEVDLEAPTIKLTKMQSGTVELPSARFGGGIYCGKKVSFFGTATDNEGVDSVYAEIKWSNETEYKHFADATLTGESFQFDLTFEKNGTAYIKFVATDKAKNYNVNSSKVVTLLVDDQAPVGEAWYIDRHINGIIYPLKDIEELKKVDFYSQDNKDVAQNGKFSICSAFKDEMGIKPGSISIQIKNEKNELICTIENSSTNDYSPVFEITHEILVNANKALATGRHFLQIWYNAEDIVELPDSNKAQDVQVPGGWFVWEPESDNPKITQSPLPFENTNEVLVNVKDTVYATLFDDDGLKEVFCALLTNSEYNQIKDNQNLATNIQEIINLVPEKERPARVKKYTPTNSTERDVRLSFTAPDSPQGMYLVCYVKDVCEKTTTKVQLINVTDASAPILHIASPANNSIPNVKMSSDSKATVTIEGQTLDTSGCTYLEFLWVPNSFDKDNNKKAEKANAVFNSISSSEYAPQSGDTAKQSLLDGGIKLWSVKLGQEETAGNGYKKQSFKFDIDLLNDFGTEKNEEKFFVVRVTRKDGKQTIQQYKLSADNLPPVIKSFKPEAKTQIVESNEDYVLEFKAEKTNRVAIDTSKYKIYQSGTETPLQGAFDSSTETYKYTIPQTTLEEWEIKTEKPVFIFEAADIFGNSVSSQYTLIINNLPQLKSITSPAPQNCKRGQEIQINANFSSAITLTAAELKDSYILLTNIKNGSSEKKCIAEYKSGAGSQTIIFEYTPKEGDYTETGKNVGVKYEYDTETTCANNLIQNCTKLKDGENVHLNTLLSSSVLDGKQIKVDAVSPKVSSILVSADKEYLKAGETVTVNVTFTEPILVQGSPALILKVGSEDFELNLESSTSDTITFKGTVTTGLNGNILYSDNCITGAQCITDNYQNVLITDDTQLTESDYVIDTIPPVQPTIKNSSGNELLAGNYQTKVDFVVAKSNTDTDISKYEYSLDGGVSWNDCTNTNKGSVTQSSVQLCARVTDKAGNVSPVSTPIALEIESSFPNYNVECMTSDGYYSTGKKITFRVTFDKKINIKDKTAKITFDGKTATIVSNIKDNVSYAEFEYTVKSTDNFNLGSKSVTVNLSGIQDSFGFTGGTSTHDINRPNVVCDGVAPTATMIPGTANGDSVNYVINGNNVYSKGNKIKITFSESVQKGRGNIILRQTAGWAIPPVLTAEEFNTICNQLNDDQKNILALRNSDGTLMEDVEDLHLHVAYRNDKYHGTGQFIGPYKKTTYGLKQSGTEYVPNVDTSFVLDFDMDIDDTSGEKKAFGTTFKKSDGTLENKEIVKETIRITNKLWKENRELHVLSKKYFSNTLDYNETELASPLDSPNDAKQISVNDIRTVLETAGVHKRELDVTSPNVEIDGSVVTITFPKGLIDKDESLPKGRKWELVIEEGSFLDMAGNSFGEDNQDSKAEVKISIDNNNKSFYSFYSAGVATPVIRVDRYSYGLGIKQSDSSGKLTSAITNDSTEPTGFVRVRIDCETSEAIIQYNKIEKSTSNLTTDDSTDGDTNYCTSKRTTTGNLKTSELNAISLNNSYEHNSHFAGGSSSLSSSLKQYIIAEATENNLGTSEKGVEGIFKTVVHFVTPKSANGDNESSFGTYKTDWSIRGTTNKYSEPSISPFPLRDTPCGSPYLRRTYKNNSDYYWVSFEILIDSTFSGQGYAVSDTKAPGDSGYGWYNWAKNWGLMWPGELTKCEGMQNWE